MGEPVKYLIAEVWECESCKDDDPEDGIYCFKCDGTGARTVVTDIEVERLAESHWDGGRTAWWEVGQSSERREVADNGDMGEVQR